LLGRIVVAARKQGISDKDHLINGNAKNVSQLFDPVGFINAGLRDINGRRATQLDRKLGNQRVNDGFHLLPLGEIRVPFHLFFQGSFLT
jgi:hypothetical protein